MKYYHYTIKFVPLHSLFILITNFIITNYNVLTPALNHFPDIFPLCLMLQSSLNNFYKCSQFPLQQNDDFGVEVALLDSEALPIQ